MDMHKKCVCKGCRTCLLCENESGVEQKYSPISKDDCISYVYCPWCDKAWPGWDVNLYLKHPNHIGTPITYPGVYIDMEFLSKNEEQSLMDGIDSIPWDLSQSGRRKQNYGPKCNFKKQKLRLGDFSGFPKFSKFVQDKFQQRLLLKKFITIEQCSLEYDPIRGASIDPHIDDCWIWGERIVTVNLLSDSVLTMTHFDTMLDKYNLPCVKSYPKIVPTNLCNDIESCNAATPESVVRIPMPRRSLLVLYGDARYAWEHRVLREDIVDRRVCLAYREFTPPYLPGGNYENEGKEIIECAQKFWVV